MCQLMISSAIMVTANTVICLHFLFANSAQFCSGSMCQVSRGELWLSLDKYQHPISSVSDWSWWWQGVESG